MEETIWGGKKKPMYYWVFCNPVPYSRMTTIPAVRVTASVQVLVIPLLIHAPNMPRKTVKHGWSAWVPAAHRAGVKESQLHCDPALTAADIWWDESVMPDLLLLLSPPPWYSISLINKSFKTWLFCSSSLHLHCYQPFRKTWHKQSSAWASRSMERVWKRAFLPCVGPPPLTHWWGSLPSLPSSPITPNTSCGNCSISHPSRDH